MFATFARTRQFQPTLIMSGKPPPGHFRLLYFASAASFTRRVSEDFPAPMAIKDLFKLLEERYPGIKKAVLSSSAVTVNLEYVDIDEENDPRDLKANLIKEQDEVAIIPPVSSG
ncbi:MAG: hypothetical protein Q9163_002491 [Psora crenata]